jgi:hypothetical protein
MITRDATQPDKKKIINTKKDHFCSLAIRTLIHILLMNFFFGVVYLFEKSTTP